MPTKKKTHRVVVVRTYSAGVHIGEIVKRTGKEVTLKNARRLWRWRGANTLNEVATRGVDQTHSRISEPVDEIVLTEAIEIIPCDAAAISNLTKSRWPS